MSLVRAPSSLRRRVASSLTRHQQRRHNSPFFALGKLSNARETQHFNRASKLSRVEHSPPLKLIQTSEVDPFAASRATSSIASGGKDELRTVSEHEWQAALEGLSADARKEVWRAWNEGEDRSKSFAQIVEEWKQKEKIGAVGETSPSDESKSKIRIQRNESDRLDGLVEMVQPDASDSSAASKQNPTEDDDSFDPGLAAEVGRAILSKQAEDKRKLRAELQEKTEELASARKEVRDQQKIVDRPRLDSHQKNQKQAGKGMLGTLILVLTGVVIYQSYRIADPIANDVRSGATIARLRRELDELSDSLPSARDNLQNRFNAEKASKYDSAERQISALRRKSREEAQQAQSKHDKEIASLQSKLTLAAADAEKEKLTHDAVISDQLQVRDQLRNQIEAHEAKMADWTKKAEELKQAVEKKDVSSLTKAQQDAYLEALVFLKVKDRSRASWLSRLFWRDG